MRWFALAKRNRKRDAAFRLQLAAIAAQGDAKAIATVVKSLLDEDDE